MRTGSVVASRVVGVLVLGSLLAAPASADEGMWLFSAPPRDAIKTRYGITLTDAWLEHQMKSAVRFNSGGSGAFVSGDGLVITNHHIGLDDLQKLGDEKNNYARDGFVAKSRADELKCLDLELNALESIEDVTARVNAAIPPGAAPGDAALARRKVMTEIETESKNATGLRSDVVTLYQGGAYHLYRYKRYTDIRLVFAPEASIAAFGGDPDNFEYPRYCYDVCFYRVYENGVPLKPAHFLKWSAAAAKEGDLAFVSGHPGATRRLLTVPELEYIRDLQLPNTLRLLKRREVLLAAWSSRSIENARRAFDELDLGIRNTRKLSDGQLAALQDPRFFGAKVAAEAAFKRQLADRPGGQEAIAAFERIAAAQRTIAGLAPHLRLFESASGFTSDSFSLARTLLRAAEERPKPNGERLREFTEARRESLEQNLFSDEPIHADLEIVKLTDALTYLVEELGANDPLVRQVLAGRSPAAAAAELINGTKVRDVAFRKQLYAGGSAAVAAARDPMVEVARVIDPAARAARKIFEAEDETKRQAHAIIGQARFALESSSNYPDATFTLRLSYGPIKGYIEAGQPVPAVTTIAGLFERNARQENNPPFDLPAKWLEKKSALNPPTPFNFVSTCDTVGGNSGSPTVNSAGELIGLLFDGNLQSLSGDFGYEEQMSRSIHVHSAGILEGLRKVYGLNELVNELVAGKPSG